MKTSSTPFAILEFHGAAGEVTGANFLIEIAGKRILIDCGLHQGSAEDEAGNWKPFAYDPASIDYLIITHAHTDHIGKVPKLVKDGFRGVIYSTMPTKEIAQVMFLDMVGLLLQDAKDAGRPKLYNDHDIEKTMSLWKPIPYHNKLVLGDDLSAFFYDAGHVLGSALVEIAHASKKILFTGDLGNSPALLLRDTETFMEPDYLLMESVYGDRNHVGMEHRAEQLETIIDETIRAGGTLMIPSFSLERTQEMLFEINDLVEGGHIERVPIFLDSPLAAEITEIYSKSTEFFNPETRKVIRAGDDIFQFPGLKVTRTTLESKSINNAPSPKIIIAGSGMMNGGRILHHARQHLSDPNSTLLLVGYQAVNTLGRLLQNGERFVNIMGDQIEVRARIETISGYSGHKGSDGLVEFVDSVKDNLKEVFCVMGETKSALFLAQRIRDTVGVKASAPREGDRIELR